MSKTPITKTSVHPLVLLSIVDHFNRVNLKQRNKRVIGALLGTINDEKVEVVNSYAIPFEEDPSQSSIWFLDHLYHEAMYDMMRKISQKEKFIGWYTTGDSFKGHDIQINEIFRKYADRPIFLLVDVQHSNQLGLPTQAFITQEEVNPKTGSIYKSFFHIQSGVDATEPEQIGVEHLLREIKQIPLNSLESSISQKVQALRGLSGKIQQIVHYLRDVKQSKLPANNKIMFLLQQIINLLPNLNSEQLIKCFAAKNNDMMFAIYVCAMIRCVLSLHTLIFVGKNNQQKQKQLQLQRQQQKKIKQEKKVK